MLEPGELVVLPDVIRAPFRCPRRLRVERVDGEARLARSRHAGVMQQKVPSGIAAVTLARLFARAPCTVSFLPVPLRRFAGIGTARPPGQIIGGQAVLAGEHVVELAVLQHHLAAMLAGARLSMT